MTEAEWNACTDPERMLEFLRKGIVILVDELPTEVEREAIRKLLQGPFTTRKLRLFACGLCRRIWTALVDERSREAVDVLEKYSDGFANDQQLWAASAAALDARNSINSNRKLDQTQAHVCRVAANAVWQSLSFEPAAAAQESADVAAWIGVSATLTDASSHNSQVLHCLFGPQLFHPVIHLDASWRNGTVNSLAEAIYTDRAFDRLPILADVLEDAGCTDADILAHCRGPGPHVRGCWVVDLLTGRE